MPLSQKQVDSISQTVYRQFPEVKGVAPSVKTQSAPQAKSMGSGARAGHYLLTFKGTASLPGGKSLPRLVRVVADERGKIIKVSTSR